MTQTLQPPAATERRAGPMLAVLVSAMFMGQFDFTAVNVAAPSVERDLAAGPETLELIVAGYAFAYASGLITGARLGDMFGYRRVFAGGMASFVLASLLCGIATSPAQLVGARLVQGLTAAVMIPQILAMITTTYPPARRPAAIACYAAVAGAGGISGLIVGGLLTQADLGGLSWRLIFLINLPIGAIGIPLALRLLPPATGSGRARLDLAGAAGVALAVALMLVPLGLGHSQGWPAWTWACMAAAVPVLALTLHWQRALSSRGGQPVLDLSLFRSGTFVAGAITNLVFLAFYASYLFTLGLMLQLGHGLDPAEAGLAFVPSALAFTTVSLLGQKLTARYGLHVALAGCLVSIAGLAFLWSGLRAYGDDVSMVWVITAVLLIGTGNGLIFPSLVAVALVRVRPEQAGAASGILSTTQQFGMAAGIGIFGAVFFAVAGDAPGSDDYASAMTWVAGTNVILAAAVMLLIRVVMRAAREA